MFKPCNPVPFNQVKSITIWGINYAPEKTGIGPQTTWLARGLVELGVKVDVVCAFSYYPAWLKNPKDAGKLYRSEQLDGVDVRRNWLYVPQEPSLVSRTLQQLSFVFFSALRILFSKPSDLYLVVSPPFLFSPMMRILAYLKGCAYVVHLQDDEVSAAYETTNLGDGLFRVFKTLEIWGHQGAECMSTISHGMVQLLKDQMNKRHHPQIHLLSNRVADSTLSDQTLDLDLKSKLNTKRLLVYSGNLGDKQVLNDLIPVVSSFLKEDVVLYICGVGAQQKRLQTLIEKQGDRADNIVFRDLLPDDEYYSLLASADACVLSEMTHCGEWLSPGICFASKMLSYLKQSKPLFVYAGEDSEVGQIVSTNKCGFSFFNYSSLQDMIQVFVDSDEKMLLEMGVNGNQFYETLTTSFCLDDWFLKICQKPLDIV